MESNEKNLNFLIIGLGSMGKRRIRNLQYLGFNNIIAIEPNEERRKEVEKQYKIRVVSSFESVILTDIDAIIISTPPDLHTIYSKKAVEFGKHFFVEASVINDGLDEINKMAKSKCIIAAPSCTMRFKQSIQKIKQLVDSKAVGKPLSLTYHMGQYLPDWHPWEEVSKFYAGKRKTGAGREMFCFELEWLTWIFGGLNMLTCIKEKISNINADIDDTYALVCKFDSGVVGTIMIDVISRLPIRSLQIMCSDGNIDWDWNTSTVRSYNARDKQWTEFKELEKNAQPDYWAKDDMYIEEMRYFINCILKKEKQIYTLDDDIKILKSLTDAEKSSEQGIHLKV
ncbi:MAG: Gfo/Idh/MocA family oxidoreductase [Candidatus Micrarchaeia archaeon]